MGRVDQTPSHATTSNSWLMNRICRRTSEPLTRRAGPFRLRPGLSRYRSEPMSDSSGLVAAAEKGRAQSLCPHNLVGGHARPELVSVHGGQPIPLRDGKVQPGIGAHVIGRHAVPVGVHEAKVMLGAFVM